MRSGRTRKIHLADVFHYDGTPATFGLHFGVGVTVEVDYDVSGENESGGTQLLLSPPFRMENLERQLSVNEAEASAELKQSILEEAKRFWELPEVQEKSAAFLKREADQRRSVELNKAMNGLRAAITTLLRLGADGDAIRQHVDECVAKSVMEE